MEAAAAMHPAAARLRARAEARATRTNALAIYTDATTFARGRFPATLVAIARETGYAIVLAIDNSEFGPEQQMAMMGLKEAHKPAPIELAQAVMAAQPVLRRPIGSKRRP